MKKSIINKSRIIICALAAFLVASLFMSVPASAMELDTPVKLGVVPAGDEYLGSINEEDILYDLYKVADVEKKDSYEAYDFKIRDFYKTGSSPVVIKDDITADMWQVQASNALIKAVTENDKPLIKGRSLTGSQKLEKADDGSVLMPGLYLLVARGASASLQDPSYYADFSDPTQPKTIVESGEYIYRYAPALIALPYTDKDIDGTITHTSDGEWFYEVTVHLKTERTVRYGNMRIVKRLLVYQANTEARFAFHVNAVFRGENIIDEDVIIDFDPNGEQTKDFVLNQLPIGAVVNVEERAPGEGYYLVQAENPEQIITAERTAEFLFANGYSSNPVPPQDSDSPPPPHETPVLGIEVNDTIINIILLAISCLMVAATWIIFGKHVWLTVRDRNKSRKEGKQKGNDA